MKRIYDNNSYPVWYSNLLKSLIKDKKIAHLVYKLVVGHKFGFFKYSDNRNMISG